MERTASQTDCTAASAAAGPTEQQSAWTPCHHWQYTGRATKKKKWSSLQSMQLCSDSHDMSVKHEPTGVLVSIRQAGTKKN